LFFLKKHLLAYSLARAYISENRQLTKKEVALEVAMPQQPKIPHLGHFVRIYVTKQKMSVVVLSTFMELHGLSLKNFHFLGQLVEQILRCLF
jgi:hypothetical protein